MDKIKVLVLFANPKGSDPLRLSSEDRTIRECIQRSKYRDNIIIDVRHAATVDDMRRALLPNISNENNYRIIHFSGHGTNQGLAFEDENGAVKLIPQEALADFLSKYPSIECVILNACYSNLQGQLISRNIPYVVGMKGAISDSGAVRFSTGFYDALGAGKDFAFAYEEGRDAIKLDGLTDGDIPEFFVNDNNFHNQEQIELINELKAKLRETDRGKFILLVVGQTGSGKSSTINTLMGEIVSTVSPFERQTTEVSFYDGIIQDIGYTIVDTPGLGDAEKSKRQDNSYLTSIKSRVSKIDCLLFVTKLNDTRVNSVEIKTIHRISDFFDPTVWDRSVIVFTFADMVKPEKFDERLKMRAKLIRDEIAKYAGELISRNIPVVAVANDEDTHEPLNLPNGEAWLGNLYTEVFTRISKEGALPFYLATISRVVRPSKDRGRSKKHQNSKQIVLNSSQAEKIDKHIEASEEPLFKKIAKAVASWGEKAWKALFG